MICCNYDSEAGPAENINKSHELLRSYTGNLYPDTIQQDGNGNSQDQYQSMPDNQINTEMRAKLLNENDDTESRKENE